MHSSRMRTARSSNHLLGGVYLSACWDTQPTGCGSGNPQWCGPGHPPRPDPSTAPWVWAWRPPPPRPDPSTAPWVWAWRPLQARSLKCPLGVGLETPPGQSPQLPPWVWAWRPHKDLQGMLGYQPPPPPVNRMTDRCKNFTLPQTSFDKLSSLLTDFN